MGFKEENAVLQFDPLLQALQLMQFVESPSLEGFNSPNVALGDIVVALAVLGNHWTLKGLSQLKQFHGLWWGKEAGAKLGSSGWGKG